MMTNKPKSNAEGRDKEGDETPMSGMASVNTFGESHDVREHLEALRSDIVSLRSDLSSLARSVAAAGEVSVRRLGKTVREKADVGKSHITEMAADLRESGRDAIWELRENIERRPFSVTLSAFAGGLILGALLFRSSH